MSERTATFLKEWHRIVAERDIEALSQVLAADVTIGAPPYWSRLEGHDLVLHLLGLILETIEDFTYHREWQDDAELALEFRGRVGDTQLQAIDLITLNDRGEVQNIDVLMRPHNAIGELRERIAPKMAEFLSSRAKG